jgi:hypothetical protein
MNKIRCDVCNEELVSIHMYDLVSCTCTNKAFTEGDDYCQIIGANDLSKMSIWRDDSESFEKITL